MTIDPPARAPTSAPSPISLLMRPAWRSENLYCGMLADAVAGNGVAVREMGFGPRDVPMERAVILIHWPSDIFLRRDARRDARSLAILARIGWARWRYGSKLVWLVHNIVPHERDLRAFAPARRWFMALLDGAIFLSETSAAAARAVYPRLGKVPALVTVHGHYLPRAHRPPAPPAPIGDRPVHFASVGRIKRYKAPERLAAAMAALPPGAARVTIAGLCDEPALRAELTALASDPSVSLRLGALDDEALERTIDEADAIVMPYRDILNSGSALHVLSRGRPFIAPRLGSLIELAAAVGRDWVFLYDGEFGPETLLAAARWVRETPRPHLPDLSRFDWAPIGRDVARFARKLAGSGAA